MRGGKNKLNINCGDRFGRLIIVKEVSQNKWGRRQFDCICSCDSKTKLTVLLSSLVSGHTKSCGCYSKERIVLNNTKHGLCNDKIYNIWVGMKARCLYSSQKYYKNYGGRGIKICDDWLNNFSIFYDWCINNGWQEGLEIDRENNDGNYEPNNCRFISHQKNTLNCSRLRVSNSSGYYGVSFHKSSTKYQSRITYGGKFIFSKSFSTAKQAALARDIFVIKNDLPHKLNFPELQLWSSL